MDALLGATREAAPDIPLTPEQAAAASIRRLPVEQIQRGRYQPRRHFDEDKLRELADSIAAQGMVQPIVVRPVDAGCYEIIAGERRWRAAQLAGLAEAPVVVHEVDDQTAMVMALIENIQRDDLNPLEEASALHRLLDEFGMTHQLVAQAVGKSRTTVTNLIRLLELAPGVKALVEQGALEMGHARALLALKDETVQLQAAHEVANKGLSVRDTEALVRRLNDPPKKTSAEPTREDPDIRRLLEDLTERLGARVVLKQGKGGKGRLEIAYNSLDELEGILAHIK